jgi:hypothetical protein
MEVSIVYRQKQEKFQSVGAKMETGDMGAFLA